MLSDNDMVNVLVPIAIGLASNENNFTCRVSAVNLMSHIYSRAGKLKETIRIKFNDLCHEETPMVKRAVADKIGEFGKVLEK